MPVPWKYSEINETFSAVALGHSTGAEGCEDPDEAAVCIGGER
jgi:hypothetical protein